MALKLLNKFWDDQYLLQIAAIILKKGLFIGYHTLPMSYISHLNAPKQKVKCHKTQYQYENKSKN